MTAPDPEREVLDTAQVAKKFSVARETVSHWSSSGKLPPDFRTPGGRPRWYADRIEKLTRGEQP